MNKNYKSVRAGCSHVLKVSSRDGSFEDTFEDNQFIFAVNKANEYIARIGNKNDILMIVLVIFESWYLLD